VKSSAKAAAAVALILKRLQNSSIQCLASDPACPTKNLQKPNFQLSL
jgi:hypothetical protein